MKIFNSLLVLHVVLLSLSCNANDKSPINGATVKWLIKHYFSDQARIIKNDQPYFKTGDFNGDGVEDIAILFLPRTKPKTSAHIKVSTPWVYPGSRTSKIYRKSIAIFHGDQEGDWLSTKSRAFALVDTSGALETPSFELLVTRKSEKDYKNHRDMLPVNTSYDLIIIPTEAGIDTYIYWDKDNYKLFEPEEIP
ncbi:MAG: hypothetical protein KAR13_18360 [Desulfobulbaceae bacterium]|nr:hypothetical protein [Desulfobulbaceae bacterium]